VILFNHDRVAADLDIDEAIIEVVCEVSGDEHANRLLKALKKSGYDIYSKKQGGYELFNKK
ncbi:MAG: threonine ammonia-lyase, partial [Butyricicoccus pullicaecorum]